VYRTLWRKPLDTLLKSLEIDSVEFSYLPSKTVKNLQLKQLGFYENVLLVRNEYTNAERQLEDWYNPTKPDRGEFGSDMEFDRFNGDEGLESRDVESDEHIEFGVGDESGEDVELDEGEERTGVVIIGQPGIGA
jgi:hypothetical protein